MKKTNQQSNQKQEILPKEAISATQDVAEATESDILKMIEGYRSDQAGEDSSKEKLLVRIYDLVCQRDKLLDMVKTLLELPQQSGLQTVQPNQPNLQGKPTAVQSVQRNQAQSGKDRQFDSSTQRKIAELLKKRGTSEKKASEIASSVEEYLYGGKSPASTGSTKKTLKKKGYIPKSQVEKMSREEIREMFELIDKSRKEW